MKSIALTIEANRDAYFPEQAGPTFTVRQLIGILNAYDGETPVYISNDRGYSCGAIDDDCIRECILD